MRIALVNPPWEFEGSIYFGCREPHLPLEFGYARALLQQDGHEVQLFDGQLDGLDLREIQARHEVFAPDMTVITTAPSYLFWRCAPPELRIPQQVVRALRASARSIVIIGPHASTTPAATLGKLGADVVVMGESEETLRELAGTPRGEWDRVPHTASLVDGRPAVRGTVRQADMAALPALHWDVDSVRRHHHHHHRFDAPPAGPGAEMEASRGCPYHCSFCAKDNFRNAYRKRPLGVILEELDALIGQGIEYVYFIDEIFLPNRELLDAVVERPVIFGVQTRIDLWNPPMLELLGRAGCVSIEAGIESISQEGRDLLDKQSRLSTEELGDRLIHARRHVPFVQANLIDAQVDDPELVEAWRSRLSHHGVWANKPVPLFPYPGSPDYGKLWGVPDDMAWERALAYYLERHEQFSDIQDARPRPLADLEQPADVR
jgi:anaerobic magnesium-protoporphyrin IX monomethyl ester cyclase